MFVLYVKINLWFEMVLAVKRAQSAIWAYLTFLLRYSLISRNVSSPVCYVLLINSESFSRLSTVNRMRKTKTADMCVRVYMCVYQVHSHLLNCKYCIQYLPPNISIIRKVNNALHSFVVHIATLCQ